MTGRIIDADMDQRANIDRLTAQVATLKREVDQYEAQLQLERREGRELGLMYAGSNERLQESLTAAEQERDDFKRIVEVWRKRHGGAEDRVRMLEGALREVVRWGDKLLWSIMSDACGWIYGIAKDALTPAPPAETPAPMDAECPPDGYEFARMDDERDRLRAELAAEKKLTADLRAGQQNDDRDHRELTAKLAAANETIERLKAEVDVDNKLIASRDELLGLFDCPAHGQCIPHAMEEVRRLREAHAATKVQLGRAVAALRVCRDAINDELYAAGDDEVRKHPMLKAHKKARDRADAILADADGTQAAEVWRVITENADARLRELAIRLVAAGPKACAVSASECHEITNAVVTICDALAAVDARRGTVKP